MTSDNKLEIEQALSSPATLPREKVLLWIESATDLPTLAGLHKLTGEAYYRIQPNLGEKPLSPRVHSRDVPDSDEIDSLGGRSGS